MAVQRWSVEDILNALRDLSPEARQEVLEMARLRLAEPAFNFWDNPEDAAYDTL